jgi:hypothetical protein
MTPSLNLYVSQHTTTGIECCFAIIATNAVPALEKTEPLDEIEWAPRRTREGDDEDRREGREGRRAYVVGMEWEVRTCSRALPEEKKIRKYARNQHRRQRTF